MKSAALGKGTSAVEVLNVSPNGFWLLLGAEELFASFEDFLWFRDATIGQISNLQLQSTDHLYWPDLDIDLSTQSIRNPKAFPLVSSTVVGR
jgi:hypothetical protein